MAGSVATELVVDMAMACGPMHARWMVR